MMEHFGKSSKKRDLRGDSNPEEEKKIDLVVPQVVQTTVMLSK